MSRNNRLIKYGERQPAFKLKLNVKKPKSFLTLILNLKKIGSLLFNSKIKSRIGKLTLDRNLIKSKNNLPNATKTLLRSVRTAVLLLFLKVKNVLFATTMIHNRRIKLNARSR